MSKIIVDNTKVSEEKKISFGKDLFIVHPGVSKARKAISEVHRASKEGADPKCLLLTGVAGSGKTATMRYYETRFPRHNDEKGPVVPILFTTIPAPATIKGMAAYLLDSLGDPMACTGSITSQTMRLHRLIKESRVELIMLDDGQHLLNSSSNRVTMAACQWLKHLINATGISMVLAGTPPLVHIFSAHEQLKTRVATRIDLAPFGWETEAEQMNFMRVLKTIEMRLPFQESSHLDSREMAFRLFGASQGVMSRVMDIVREAARLALDRGEKNITLNVFALAYHKIFAFFASNKANPFLMDISELARQFMKPSERHGDYNLRKAMEKTQHQREKELDAGLKLRKINYSTASARQIKAVALEKGS